LALSEKEHQEDSLAVDNSPSKETLVMVCTMAPPRKNP
jgi:hypothetical protein